MFLDDIFTYSKEGYRTLVMAFKFIPPEVFYEFKRAFEKITLSSEDSKNELLYTLYNKIENDLSYVGCSAIEDKLQDEVGETIESLMEANIKIWVLTGDKKETSIEIGKSCNLIKESTMKMVDLIAENKKALKELLKENYKSIIEEECESYYILIDGHNLTYIFEDPYLTKIFFTLGLNAKSLIACRVSPSQKSLIVSMAKDNCEWITLAIGDGANDVPMLMEAHIGVGIGGNDGTQAVRCSDYAISEFKHLKRLLFVHGRWGYKRISLFICYYFYKNIILVFTELYFVFFNGFSGQVFFPDFLPKYNINP